MVSVLSVGTYKEWRGADHQGDQLRSTQPTDLHRKHRAWELSREPKPVPGVEIFGENIQDLSAFTETLGI